MTSQNVIENNEKETEILENPRNATGLLLSFLREQVRPELLPDAVRERALRVHPGGTPRAAPVV